MTLIDTRGAVARDDLPLVGLCTRLPVPITRTLGNQSRRLWSQMKVLW